MRGSFLFWETAEILPGVPPSNSDSGPDCGFLLPLTSTRSSQLLGSVWVLKTTRCLSANDGRSSTFASPPVGIPNRQFGLGLGNLLNLTGRDRGPHGEPSSAGDPTDILCGGYLH